jgi:hypothetical protein
VARGRLENQPSDLIFPPKMNAANERLAQHLWPHHDDLFTFLRQPGPDKVPFGQDLGLLVPPEGSPDVVPGLCYALSTPSSTSGSTGLTR